MKKRIIIAISALLLIAGLYFANKVITIQGCLSCSDDIEKKYESSEGSTPETYVEDCRKEYKQGKVYPFVKPAYAVLHFDKLFRLPERLSQEQTESIIKILNDSSSFIWGEFGTAYYDRFVTFHDSDDNYIGMTQIDFGGQTRSTPHLARMKWGMLTDKAYQKLRANVK